MEDIERVFIEKIQETIPEKRPAKLLAKRCIKGAENYIISNGITDNNNCVLSMKLDYLYKKLTPEIIMQLQDEKTRVKTLLSTDIYEIDSSLKNYREFLNSKVAPVNANSCSFYTCPRCKSRDHTYKEVQYRSIDEPRMVKCVCNVCTYRYSVG